jgi:biotin carboxyl carrier protein
MSVSAINYTIRSGKSHSVSIDRNTDFTGSFTVNVNDREYRICIRKTHPDGRIKSLLINNRVYPVEVLRHGDGSPYRVYLKGVPFDVNVESVESTRVKPETPERNISGEICSVLPGQVIKYFYKEGESVQMGQPLLILEAMKMENEILAPKSGIIEKIHVKEGVVVAKGDLLVEIADNKEAE